MKADNCISLQNQKNKENTQLCSLIIYSRSTNFKQKLTKSTNYVLVKCSFLEPCGLWDKAFYRGAMPNVLHLGHHLPLNPKCYHHLSNQADLLPETHKTVAENFFYASKFYGSQKKKKKAIGIPSCFNQNQNNILLTQHTDHMVRLYNIPTSL